ncbi:hypothetical protein MLD38_021324 [Melastoma candidum]|uniref:Uncharacterized protein n=1 Tax=Melastoma candidum TaxID=119954 RepID=A0ACB9QG96_9MYRT|nr:hypothetical protein MLD38_021324 [Melastoma candidum]
MSALRDPGATPSKTPPSSSSFVRRPRWRPPGSRNKPKHPVVVPMDTPNVLSSHLLEVESGSDIIRAVDDYACHRGRGICILSGIGAVANVTVR